MTETYSFFDARPDGNGEPDRIYNAEEFTDYFDTLVTTGVMRGRDRELEVSTDGVSMISKIDTGVAYINAKRYANSGFKEHTHDTEVAGKDRIDRIVIRMDLNPDKRHVLSFIKKGVASATPVPPALTQTEKVYEISLAQVRVTGGQAYIATGAVTSERGIAVICPWAGSNILPSFDDNALAQLERVVATHLEESDQHFNNQQVHVTPEQKTEWNNKMPLFATVSVDDPDTTFNPWIVTDNLKLGGGWWYLETRWINGKDSGIKVQNAYRYTGKTMGNFKTRYCYNDVWSPWSPSIEELFTLFGDKNRKIASAITEMGVPTNADATGDQMAANIRAIETGRKSATGVLPLLDVGGEGRLAVWGLGFTPSVIIAYEAGSRPRNIFHAVYSPPFDTATYAYNNGAPQFVKALVAIGEGFEIRITPFFTSAPSAQGNYVYHAFE